MTHWYKVAGLFADNLFEKALQAKEKFEKENKTEKLSEMKKYYEEAANLYPETDKTFEEIALKFVYEGNEEGL